MKSIFLCGPIASALVLAAAAQAAEIASPMRDPMQPPSAVPASPRAVDSVAPTTEITPRHLMVVDGRRYLIAGGRRLGVGDLLGGARIERIDDGAVWLRDGGALRQLSLFGGVAKRVQGAEEAASSSAPSPGNPSPIQKSTLPTGKRS
jgi:hypothetical protein